MTRRQQIRELLLQELQTSTPEAVLQIVASILSFYTNTEVPEAEFPASHRHLRQVVATLYLAADQARRA